MSRFVLRNEKVTIKLVEKTLRLLEHKSQEQPRTGWKFWKKKD